MVTQSANRSKISWSDVSNVYLPNLATLFLWPWRSTHEYRFWFWNLRRCCNPCPHPKSIACGLRFATGSCPLFHTGRIFAGLSQSLCGSNVCHHCMGKVQSRFWKNFVGKATFSAFRLHPRKLLLVTWKHLLYQCYPVSIWWTCVSFWRFPASFFGRGSLDESMV